MPDGRYNEVLLLKLERYGDRRAWTDEGSDPVFSGAFPGRNVYSPQNGAA